MAVVTAACVGKSSCTITPTSELFGGDPCSGTVKQLAVALEGDCFHSMYSAGTTVPVGAGAAIAIPTFGSAVKAFITEGGTNVWANGAFVPGTPGVLSGAPATDGVSVVLQLGSGSFSFDVFSN